MDWGRAGATTTLDNLVPLCRRPVWLFTGSSSPP